ncbi:iron ABC transporter permease [Sinorhizobium sp. BG8]|uniref:FecCD family ABC transporter permease n=1 Tax=Sinorhizobium sp. BG8 TaxID=2613773 RepID=UPI00193CD029|nr:iron ABC transporter permease [Sinorhizobium sp. BG8]
MRGGFVLLGAVLVGSALLSLMIGQVMLTPAELWSGLWTGSGPGALTLRVLRGPNIVAAIGTGAVFGASGAAFQILLRNPLAAPDVMGFTSGAGLAVVAGVAFGVALPMPLLSAAGGLTAALVVAVLSLRRDSAQSTITLILVGLGIGFFTSAASGFLLTRLPPQEAAEAQRWLTGSLAARNWTHAVQVLVLGAILAVALGLQVRALALLELGDDLATGLGLKVQRARRRIAATAVLLAASGVAVAGPVPFVALMAGPLGARLTGASEPAARIAAASLAGAVITVLADLAARAAVPGLQLPVGVMTGLFGAPYLLWLLAREMETGDL